MAGQSTGKAASPEHVRLEGVPARLFVESQNHQEGLLRELTLMDYGKRFHLSDVEPPARIASLVSDIHHQYADVRSATRRQALDALARGEDTVDLRVPVRSGMAGALQQWLQLIEDADTLCDEGVLLTLPASPEVRRLRRWYAEAIVACLAGADQDGQEPVAVYPAA